MKKKKKKAALPSVTVLAYDAKQLARFVAAVEGLSLLVNDLRVVAAELLKLRRKPKEAPPESNPPK